MKEETKTNETNQQERPPQQALRNNLFGGLQSEDIKTLNRQVARPMPLWSYMYTTVNERTGKQAKIPCASMLAIVSSYDTVLSIQDAIVPIEIQSKDKGLIKTQRHYRFVNGKPKPHVTDIRSPLAYLNHEYLHRVLYQCDSQAREILKKKRLPEELQSMVAGFRLIRCYRDKHKYPDGRYSGMMVQRWQIFKIDETIAKNTHSDKPPIIDIPKALELDYELQCPPVFEMMPRGFSNQLMKDLARFLGADEPFQAETTTAHKYKMWRASETIEQFNLMFAQEEEQRREAIAAAGRNISAMPFDRVLAREGKRPRKAWDRTKKQDTPRQPKKTGGFGLAGAQVSSGTTDLPQDDAIEENPFSSESDDGAAYGFGLQGRPLECAVVKPTTEEDEEEESSPFGSW